jgi:NAD(P)-dependent dehydrogenase (short-subunit alcohol dehydrogenase family)
METVVITGASAGVGRAVARAFAREGARLGLVAHGAEGLEGAKREVEAIGGEALPIPTDVADASQVEEAASRVEEAFGAIDVWVNNAMVSVFAPFSEITAEEYRRVTEVTYLGTVYGTMAAVRRMLPRDRGSIVQVGSALAYRAIPLQSAYCGAKHAIEGFSESLRCELLHERSNVLVTMVQLPALNTPQFDVVRSKLPRRPQPVPPVYQPEVAAQAVLWAARHRRREVWVGGSTVVVLTGNKLAAGLGDRYLARTGYDSQQTQESAPADSADNLWEPIAGDHGAHGRFDSVARRSCAQLWLNSRRWHLAAAGAGLGLLMALRRRRTS